jgi:hypothetical protein
MDSSKPQSNGELTPDEMHRIYAGDTERLFAFADPTSEQVRKRLADVDRIRKAHAGDRPQGNSGDGSDEDVPREARGAKCYVWNGMPVYLQGELSDTNAAPMIYRAGRWEEAPEIRAKLLYNGKRITTDELRRLVDEAKGNGEAERGAGAAPGA